MYSGFYFFVFYNYILCIIFVVIKMLKRINDLIEDILENIAENNEKFKSGEFYTERGKGSPKHLKYRFSSCWSRRIDKKNRLVYRVCNKKLEIIECKTHYGNK